MQLWRGFVVVTLLVGMAPHNSPAIAQIGRVSTAPPATARVLTTGNPGKFIFDDGRSGRPTVRCSFSKGDVVGMTAPAPRVKARAFWRDRRLKGTPIVFQYVELQSTLQYRAKFGWTDVSDPMESYVKAGFRRWAKFQHPVEFKKSDFDDAHGAYRVVEKLTWLLPAQIPNVVDGTATEIIQRYHYGFPLRHDNVCQNRLPWVRGLPRSAVTLGRVAHKRLSVGDPDKDRPLVVHLLSVIEGGVDVTGFATVSMHQLVLHPSLHDTPGTVEVSYDVTDPAGAKSAPARATVDIGLPPQIASIDPSPSASSMLVRYSLARQSAPFTVCTAKVVDDSSAALGPYLERSCPDSSSLTGTIVIPNVDSAVWNGNQYSAYLSLRNEFGVAEVGPVTPPVATSANVTVDSATGEAAGSLNVINTAPGESSMVDWTVTFLEAGVGDRWDGSTQGETQGGRVDFTIPACGDGYYSGCINSSDVLDVTVSADGQTGFLSNVPFSFSN